MEITTRDGEPGAAAMASIETAPAVTATSLEAPAFAATAVVMPARAASPSLLPGPVRGTDRMLQRLRARGRDLHALHQHLGSLRLFDVDPLATDDERTDTASGAVVTEGGRSHRRYHEHPIVATILEHRDRYLDGRESIDGVRMAIAAASAGMGELSARERAAGAVAITALARELRLMEARSLEHLKQIQRMLQDAAEAVGRHDRYEFELVSQDVRWLRETMGKAPKRWPAAGDLMRERARRAAEGGGVATLPTSADR